MISFAVSFVVTYVLLELWRPRITWERKALKQGEFAESGYCQMCNRKIRISVEDLHQNRVVFFCSDGCRRRFAVRERPLYVPPGGI